MLPSPGPPSSSHLGDLEPIHLEEAETASPAANGYHLPLWVESDAVEGLGTGVLGGQLPADRVPQLDEREGEEDSGCWTQMPEPLSPRAPGATLSSPLPSAGQAAGASAALRRTISQG